MPGCHGSGPALPVPLPLWYASPGTRLPRRAGSGFVSQRRTRGVGGCAQRGVQRLPMSPWEVTSLPSAACSSVCGASWGFPRGGLCRAGCPRLPPISPRIAAGRYCAHALALPAHRALPAATAPAISLGGTEDHGWVWGGHWGATRVGMRVQLGGLRGWTQGGREGGTRANVRVQPGGHQGGRESAVRVTKGRSWGGQQGAVVGAHGSSKEGIGAP